MSRAHRMNRAPSVRFASFDARYDGGHIEVGIFAGEECVEVVKLPRKGAGEFLRALNAAIEAYDRARRPRQDGLPL